MLGVIKEVSQERMIYRLMIVILMSLAVFVALYGAVLMLRPGWPEGVGMFWFFAPLPALLAAALIASTSTWKSFAADVERSRMWHLFLVLLLGALSITCLFAACDGLIDGSVRIGKTFKYRTVLVIERLQNPLRYWGFLVMCVMLSAAFAYAAVKESAMLRGSGK